MLHRSFDLLTGLFDCVVLRTNTKKTKVLILLTGKICRCLSVDAYRARVDAKSHEGWKDGKVNCRIFGQTLKEGLLWTHLESQYDVFWSFTLDAAVTEPQAEGRRWAV